MFTSRAVFRFLLPITVWLASVAVGAAPPPTAAQEGTATPAGGTAYPLTIQNCGVDLTLPAAPRRVVVMEAAAMSMLAEIGALDRVVARIGVYPPEYFSPEVNAAIAQIPELAAERGATGGAVISLETILDLQPDLIIGYETETITRESLDRFGIGLYVIPPFCDEPPPVSFESVYEEVRLYGQIFDRNEAAAAAATTLEQDVAAVLAAPAASGERAAALYIAAEGSAIYGYSRLGMVDVQMTALGLTNIYVDLPERVAEISIESLIDGDPDVLILLYSDPALSPEQVISRVTNMPGADAMSAVRNGRLYPLLFNFSEPPSPLAVQGLAILAEFIAR